MVSRAKLMKTGTAPKSMAEQLGEAKVTAVGTTLCTWLIQKSQLISRFALASVTHHMNDDF